MISIQYTTPSAGSAGLFLNDPIIISFDQVIDSSYFTMDYFMLYRTNSSYSEYYDQSNITVSLVDDTVRVKPTVDLTPSSYYMLMIIGGDNGIESTTNDHLGENFILQFMTGDSIRVSDTPSVTIHGVDTFVPGTSSPSSYSPSVDLFALSGDNVPISVISTIPTDLSLGIDNLSKIVIRFNDKISNITLPENILVGRYNDIPYDFDPFSDNTIIPTGVVVSGDIVIFDIPLLSGDTNKEYNFQLAPGIIQGVTKRALMYNTYSFKFYSRLTPLYATPDQIITRLKGFSDQAVITIPRAEIYKLILEASMYILEKYKITVTPEIIPILNRLIICMVLRDILTNGFISGSGNIKSRTLIATKVEYYNFDTSGALDALNDCIESAIADASEIFGISAVSSGIKSGNVMNRPTKEYGIYR